MEKNTELEKKKDSGTKWIYFPILIFVLLLLCSFLDFDFFIRTCTGRLIYVFIFACYILSICIFHRAARKTSAKYVYYAWLIALTLFLAYFLHDTILETCMGR